MPVVYSAVERFDPACGDRWADYVRWSGLSHLREVVSLDILLCPTIFRHLSDDDWLHNLQADFQTHLFRDLDHVVRRSDGDDRVMILGLVPNPTPADITSFTDPRFEFRGYDLVETQTGISALVNCGGFDRAFTPTDLSDCGLLPDLSQAADVQARLRVEYPDEPHADCDLWALWQMTNPRGSGA